MVAIAGALLADLLLVPRLGLQPPFLIFAALLLAGRALRDGRAAFAFGVILGAASLVRGEGRRAREEGSAA